MLSRTGLVKTPPAHGLAHERRHVSAEAESGGGRARGPPWEFRHIFPPLSSQASAG